ncbi:uncharacterized protein BXIN_1273 [Babesia sp. Xinjiang]|uniref:uncharacterized protein n=1 Tax=Babesia sp. Xinjiang TaxID=462227 RepID=UPI000A24A8EB|nr:uncharacterized protein BXIN_1273 [Babesia sp. Xinjiang]ORM40021.1 hypothetical protein BXIN_1273 [Babesia sp. Xinjiang]
MDARHGNTCLIAPEQGYYSAFPSGGAQCVTAVPAQEDGYMVPSGYQFSDGYSMDYQPMHYNQPIQSTVECDPSLFHGQGIEGVHQGGYEYPAPQYVQHDYGYTGADYQYYQDVMGSETIPKMVGDPAPLTTEFFASNDAFQRIPLCPTRSVFRRRRQGDPSSEWSNAFLNEEIDACDNTPCCTK